MATIWEMGFNLTFKWLTNFLDDYNNVRPNVDVTSAQEQSSSTNLIVITIGRYITNSYGHCNLAICRKSTATGYVIPRNSFHPNFHKLAAMRYFNHLTPNGHFSGRTAPLTYRCCFFYLFNKYTY